MLLGWCALTVVRVAIAIGQSDNAAVNHCVGALGGAPSRPYCAANLGAQTGVSVVSIIFVGLVGCVAISAVWFIGSFVVAVARSRPGSCALCGTRTSRGGTICATCVGRATPAPQASNGRPGCR